MSEASNGNGGTPQQELRPMVVGIGASAGGLEALQQFFSCIPGNTGLIFIIIQHLSPDYKSLMAEILGKHTSMMVLQAESEMEIEPDTVYLIPPKKNMTIRDGRLLLTDYVHGGINHPIDIFLNSLAEERKERALAIILSGTGSDGTNGIKAIKEHGGFVLVQEPTSAKFDGMPRNAINTGLADVILPPGQLAEEILSYTNYPTMVMRQEHLQGFPDEDALAHIYMILKQVSGIDFTHYKRNTVLRRIERRMLVTHCATPEQFSRLLEESPSEASLLVKDILIGVTKFFRDADYFETLKHSAIYTIVERSTESDPIRIWSAGCSTGEEAYSLAILFNEVLEETGLKRDIKIFATDVDASAIETASKGIFPESIVDDVATERLTKYFVKRNDTYQISKEIRKHALGSALWQAGSHQLPQCAHLLPACAAKGPFRHLPLSAQKRWFPLPRQERDCQRILERVHSALHCGEDLFAQERRQDGRSRSAGLQDPQYTDDHAKPARPCPQGGVQSRSRKRLHAVP